MITVCKWSNAKLEKLGINYILAFLSYHFTESKWQVGKRGKTACEMLQYVSTYAGAVCVVSLFGGDTDEVIFDLY